MRTRLEEEVFHIAKQDIHMFTAERGLVSETVLVYLDFARDSFTIQRGTKIDIRKLDRPPIWRIVSRNIAKYE
jgi:hypothetical protein